MPISTTYTIKNTQGTLSFTINVGGASGPLELQQNADLTFYGYGRTGWGQEVDQNFYRLLENFAVQEKTASPKRPKSKNTLGGILGINRPIVGQAWYNTSDSELYVCSVATTDPNIAAGDPSVAASTWRHILSDEFAETKYLKIIDASGPDGYVKLNGSNTPMTGFLELKHTSPSATWHAAPKGYVDDEINALRTESDGKFVERAGDTMSGQLSVEGPGAGSYVKIDTQTGTNQPRLHLGKYSGSISADIGFFTSGGGLLHMDSGILATGGNSSVVEQGTLTLIGFAMVDRPPTLANQITSKQYVDTAITTAINNLSSTTSGSYVKKVGDTMTGQLNMSNQRILNVGAPSTGTDATNADWVKSQAYMPAGSGVAHQVFVSVSGPSGGNSGDIWFQL